MAADVSGLVEAGAGNLGAHPASSEERIVFFQFVRGIGKFFGGTVTQLEELNRAVNQLLMNYGDYRQAASKAATEAYQTVAKTGGTFGFIFKFPEATASAVAAMESFEEDYQGKAITIKAYREIGTALGKISNMALAYQSMTLNDFVDRGIITEEMGKSFFDNALEVDWATRGGFDLPKVVVRWGQMIGESTRLVSQGAINFDETISRVFDQMLFVGRQLFPDDSDDEIRKNFTGSSGQVDRYRETLLKTMKAIHDNRQEVADLEASGWDGLREAANAAFRWTAGQMGAFLGVFGLTFEGIFGLAAYQMSIQLPKLAYATGALVKAGSTTVAAGAYEHSEVFLQCQEAGLPLEECEKQAAGAMKKEMWEKGKMEFDLAFSQIQEYSSYVADLELKLEDLMKMMGVALGEIMEILKYLLYGVGVVGGGYVLYKVGGG